MSNIIIKKFKTQNFFAEESNPLAAGASEWAYGNGDESQASFGLTAMLNGCITRLGLSVNNGSATVEILVGNGGTTGFVVTANAASENGSSFIEIPWGQLPVVKGQEVNFRTLAANGATQGGKVNALLEGY